MKYKVIKNFSYVFMGDIHYCMKGDILIPIHEEDDFAISFYKTFVTQNWPRNTVKVLKEDFNKLEIYEATERRDSLQSDLKRGAKGGKTSNLEQPDSSDNG